MIEPDFSRRGFVAGLLAAPVVVALPGLSQPATTRITVTAGVTSVRIEAAGNVIRIGESFTISGVYAAGTRELKRFVVVA